MVSFEPEIMRREERSCGKGGREIFSHCSGEVGRGLSDDAA
jgi:hypothetical protein